MSEETGGLGLAGDEGPVDLYTLEKRFRSLWLRCVGPDARGADADRVWKALQEGYTEPHRRYHGIDHLKHCLEGLDQAASVARDPDTLELAIWFHDLVYVAGAKDNEERSAEVFTGLMGPFLAPERLQRARRLIMTTTHQVQPGAGDERLIADIDLSSLAKPWPRFIEDVDKLRAEEPAKSEDEYFQAKVRFYRAMLGRKSLFNTVPFQLRYEHRGRANLQNYLALLASRGYD
jgi:predicted metal-dependent HD superfamily phosphohydrolase